MSQPTRPDDRCSEAEPLHGRCQLAYPHVGLHAAYMGGGTCITWDSDGLRYWPAYPAPPWLVALPWAAGCQLPTTTPQADYSKPVLNKTRMRRQISQLRARTTSIALRALESPSKPAAGVQGYTPIDDIFDDAD